jgi:hypothetical protein
MAIDGRVALLCHSTWCRSPSRASCLASHYVAAPLLAPRRRDPSVTRVRKYVNVCSPAFSPTVRSRRSRAPSAFTYMAYVNAVQTCALTSFNVQRGGVRSQRSHDHVHVFPNPVCDRSMAHELSPIRDVSPSISYSASRTSAASSVVAQISLLAGEGVYFYLILSSFLLLLLLLLLLLHPTDPTYFRRSARRSPIRRVFSCTL